MSTLDTFLLGLAARPRRERSFLYALIDQSGLPNIRATWPALALQAWEPVLGTRATQPDGATPLLIDVSSIAAKPGLRCAVVELEAQGRFANCISVLQSRLDVSTMAIALRRRTEAELPDHFSVVLRFFDTRTLPLLPTLLTPKQYTAFMACADAWNYVDRHGGIQTLPPPASPQATEAFDAPLRLDPAQERLLIDDGLVDAVIDQLLDQRHPALAGTTPGEQFTRVSVLVGGAARYGIDDVCDATQYCCAALDLGDDFHEHEPWASRLGKVRRGDLKLESALADVP